MATDSWWRPPLVWARRLPIGPDRLDVVGDPIEPVEDLGLAVVEAIQQAHQVVLHLGGKNKGVLYYSFIILSAQVIPHRIRIALDAYPIPLGQTTV